MDEHVSKTGIFEFILFGTKRFSNLVLLALQIEYINRVEYNLLLPI